MTQDWTDEKVRTWVGGQQGSDYWYQTIPIREGITTPGTINSTRRLGQMRLPAKLDGMTVIDVGCNSGFLALESKKRSAKRVVGIDIQENRLAQARTLAEIMGLEVEFNQMSLLDANRLGEFDVVFCIAVLTEISDVVGGLVALKKLTKNTLYLELNTGGADATAKRSQRLLRGVLDFNLRKLLGWLRLYPTRPLAELRLIKSRLMTGWALDPNRAFLGAVMGDEFAIEDLGPSERYRLFRLTRTHSPAAHVTRTTVFVDT